jgi:hypothetical protein
LGKSKGTIVAEVAGAGVSGAEMAEAKVAEAKVAEVVGCAVTLGAALVSVAPTTSATTRVGRAMRAGTGSWS